MTGEAAMRMIIVGAGGTGRELLRRLSSRWDIVVVDDEQGRLQRAGTIREIQSLVGDGSSSVVLKKAGLEEAAALVAATPDDDTNLEAIRIARDHGVSRIAGVAMDPDRLDEYRSMEVPVFSPAGLAARNIELAVEPRKVASSAFAGGKAEAIEVHIAPDASVAGKQLRELHPRTWVVVAVLRGDRLILPHGDTTIEVGDRVTVVGAASDYAAIVTTFTSGVSTFPLRYGRKVLIGIESREDVGPVVAEAVRLVRHSQADTLTVVLPDAASGGEEERVAELEGAVIELAEGVEVQFHRAMSAVPAAMVEVAQQENIGVIVVAGTDPEARFRRFRMARLLNTYGIGGLALLLARSGGPYGEIVVPARRTGAGDAAARAAIDLAAGTGAALLGIAAVAPPFVATHTDTPEEARLAMAWLREEAAVHGITVHREIRQGNPVRIIAGRAAENGLVVMGAPATPVHAVGLGISGLVASRVPSSVLLVPEIH